MATIDQCMAEFQETGGLPLDEARERTHNVSNSYSKQGLEGLCLIKEG